MPSPVAGSENGAAAVQERTSARAGRFGPSSAGRGLAVAGPRLRGPHGDDEKSAFAPMDGTGSALGS